jgi:predicted transcriptional regulator
MPSTHSKKDQAALLVSTGLSCINVAEQVGVTPESISRWKSEVEFQARVNEFQFERVNEARELLRESAKRAVKTIDSLLDSKNESTRLKAATALLKLSNIDVPQRLFNGIGSTDSLDLLEELKMRVEQTKYIFPNNYNFQK